MRVDPSTEARVLTVRQPWAAAIIHGGKSIENRTWGTKFRGTLAIHAAAGRDDALSWAETGASRLVARPDFPELTLPRGCIVGVVDLTHVHTQKPASPWALDAATHWWELRHPRPLPAPIAHTGGLGLRRLPTDLIERIAAAVNAAPANAASTQQPNGRAPL